MKENNKNVGGIHMKFNSVEEELAYTKSLLARASSLLDDVHCGDTKTAKDIDQYLYNEEEE